MRFQSITPLLQRTITQIRPFYNSHRPAFPLHSLLPFPRTQIATYIRVTSVNWSDANQHPSPILRTVTYSLPPSAFPKNGKTVPPKTYHVDVLLADNGNEHFVDLDDEPADVSWRFEVLEGEDELDRLVHYGQAFGKHGSGDKDFDKYVMAFQGKVNRLWAMRLLAGRD